MVLYSSITPRKLRAVDLQNLEWLDDSPHPVDWNGPFDRSFVEFRAEDVSRSIIGHLERVVARHAERIALSDSNSSVSFGALWQGLCAFGEILAARTEPGELIAILLPACAPSPLAMLACLAAGRPFTALDLSQPRDWIVQTLESTQPKLVVGHRESSELARIGAPGACFIDVAGLPRTAPRSWRPAELGPDQPACVLFTSGSTGRPKGIVNCQRGLLQRVAQSINAAHINADDRFLTLAPLSSIVGVRDVMTALLAGASMRLIDTQDTGPRQILSLIASERTTILFGAPALLRSTVRYAHERASPALRLVRIGGDTTLWSDVDLLREWLAPGAAIQSIYAATEAPMMQWFVHEGCRGEDPRIPIGYPLAGNRLAVIDEFGRATRAGEAGELIVRSPYVALGTWVDGRVSAETVGSPCVPGGRVLRTGDLVRVRPDGLLERLGRKDRQVKIRGVRVELEGVECAVRRHPLVHDVGVLARTSRDGETILVAYVSARDGAPETLIGELRKSMSTAPPPMRPARWYRIDEVPRMPNFKLDVTSLRALDTRNLRKERRHADVTMSASALHTDSIEATVVRIWQEVLRCPVRGPEDDFFQMGGDSLKAVRLVCELERALGIELPVTLVNEAPGLGKLCAALRERRTAGYVPLVLLKSGAGAPPVYFVHGLGGNVAELFPIARSMSYPGAVFGIQARGLRAGEQPHLTVEAMAVEYLREIKVRQPRGPYSLCGYSFGGLVAFEMARRLRQSGDGVGIVGLFDTLPSTFAWPLGASLGLARRRLARFAMCMISAPIRRWPGAIRSVAADMLMRLRNLLRQHQPDSPPVPAFLRSAPASVLKVAVASLIASARYRPRFYPGALTVFTPAIRNPALPSPQLIWRRHALALSVVQAAGTHITMLSAANAAGAAASLSGVLKLSASSGTSPKATSPSSNASRQWTAFIRQATVGYFKARRAAQ